MLQSFHSDRDHVSLSRFLRIPCGVHCSHDIVSSIDSVIISGKPIWFEVEWPHEAEKHNSTFLKGKTAFLELAATFSPDNIVANSESMY